MSMMIRLEGFLWACGFGEVVFLPCAICPLMGGVLWRRNGFLAGMILELGLYSDR